MIESLIDNIWQIWLIVAIVLLVTELTSGTLYLLCFSIGALVVTIVSLFSSSLTVHLLVLAFVSTLSIYFLRPAMVRMLHDKEEKKSNVDAIIGRIGRVSEAIEVGGFGRVAIDGDDWKAVSNDGSAIEKGKQVRVVERDSLIITVVVE